MGLCTLKETLSLQVDRGTQSTPPETPAQKAMSPTLGKAAAAVRSRRGLWEIGKTVWVEADKDDCLNLAAQMSYFFVLAMFPFFILLTSVIGSLPFSKFWSTVFEAIVRYFPVETQQLVVRTIMDFSHSREAFLSFGFLGTLWAGSSGVVSLMETLSAAYESRDTRSFWHKRLLAIAVLVALALLVLAGFSVSVAAKRLDEQAIGALHWEVALKVTAHLIRWASVLIFAVLAISFLDNVLPCKRHHWRWITPGAVFATIMILLGTLGVNAYVHISRYSQTYGSLGAFFVLMLWIYVASLMVLIGAEINSVVEKSQTRESHK